jgi:hypothetical protein
MEKERTKSFITDRPAMLEELLKSRDHKIAVGIWSAGLGQGIFLCVVKDICTDEDEQDMVIILEENGLLAPEMNSHVIYLGEITGVYSFEE